MIEDTVELRMPWSILTNQGGETTLHYRLTATPTPGQPNPDWADVFQFADQQLEGIWRTLCAGVVRFHTVTRRQWRSLTTPGRGYVNDVASGFGISTPNPVKLAVVVQKWTGAANRTDRRRRGRLYLPPITDPFTGPGQWDPTELAALKADLPNLRRFEGTKIGLYTLVAAMVVYSRAGSSGGTLLTTDVVELRALATPGTQRRRVETRL